MQGNFEIIKSSRKKKKKNHDCTTRLKPQNPRESKAVTATQKPIRTTTTTQRSQQTLKEWVRVSLASYQGWGCLHDDINTNFQETNPSVRESKGGWWWWRWRVTRQSLVGGGGAAGDITAWTESLTATARLPIHSLCWRASSFPSAFRGSFITISTSATTIILTTIIIVITEVQRSIFTVFSLSLLFVYCRSSRPLFWFCLFILFCVFLALPLFHIPGVHFCKH